MASTVNFEVDQGQTFHFQVQYQNPDKTPVDLTGASARMQIRRAAGEYGNPLFTVSSFTINPTAGTIDVSISKTDTAKFNFKKGVYDLILTDAANNDTRLIEGTITVRPGVTR